MTNLKHYNMKEQIVDISKLLTIRSYAEKKGFVKETVYLWIKTGKLPHVRIDGVLFVFDEDEKEKENK